jgi:hypothetical protein
MDSSAIASTLSFFMTEQASFEGVPMSSLLALHPITRRSLLGGIAASSALVLLHPFAARAATNQAHLRIM